MRRTQNTIFFWAYLFSKESSRSLSIVYNVTSISDVDKTIEVEKEKNEFDLLLESVEFK